MTLKNYRRGTCCFHCEHFAAYVTAADGCDKHGVRIGQTSQCDDFKLKKVE